VNKHFSARIPGALLSYERGRPVIFSRTWNHLSHFRPELAPDGRPLPHVTYGALPCVAAPRAAVERRFSVLLPWKAAESGGAKKSFAHTILFEPPELSTEEVLEESEAAAAAAGGAGQAGQGAAAAAGGGGGAVPRRAGGDGAAAGGEGADAGGAPPEERRGHKRGRVRSFGSKLHRWLWGLQG
jgi:hypothetical protein